ncbi:HEAT repeat-containing protein 1 [Actinomortierella ambigua]|uniref:U3 small nucleolar RNA-associated protein 10 n=1 Tax=Actinomortierella ambigua TaxID=1343610 RepID=A0A9P6PYU8_9FUNG|nr:HEAT repeat-containing protein 1 [Actinomortierella ambigua]
MTSLAQQLRRIGTADATRGIEKASKHKASFLFDSKQAADYDIDTIFSIGANGIAELKQLDERFNAFEKTLFAESMKSFDRTVQSKDDNAKLDESITLFLRQVSPFFMLKPAGKALEWLIRRFRINEYNVDAILHAILPYHETALFVTMVSILQIDEASRWAFLRPIRKSKQPLDRSVLIQNMTKDRSLVEFVCDTVLQAVNRRTSFKTLVSFYAAVMLQYIASVPVVSDEVLTAVFPYVLEGLKSKGSPEFQIASYMIISQISERATLTVEVLNSLFATMSSNHVNTYQMLLCMIHVCQTQETLVEFPEKAFRNITRIDNVDDVLLSITNKYNTLRFLHPFAVALTKFSSKHENFSRILVSILREEKVPAFIVKDVASSIMDLYLADCAQTAESKEINPHSVTILNALHELYSKDLDEALQDKMKESAESSAHKQLYAFISKIFNGTRHQPLKESNTTLFLSMNHPEASIRFIAVKRLADILNDPSSPLSNVDSEDTFVRDSLLARLQDDDERIVQLVLGMGALKTFVEPQELLQALVTVITAERSTRGTRRHCLVYLLTTFLSNNKDLKQHVLEVVLGHILLVKEYYKASIALLSKISTSELKNEPLLAGVGEVIKDLVKDEKSSSNADLLVPANAALISRLAANVNAHPHGLETYLKGIQSSNAMLRLVSILVLTKAIHQLDAARQVKVAHLFLSPLLERLSSISSTNKTVPAETKDGLPSKDLLMQIVTKMSLPSTELSTIYFSLLTLVSDLKAPKGAETAWLSAEPRSEYASILISLYNVFVGTLNITPYEKMIEKLFELHLTTDAIEFLCSQWTDASASNMTQLRSLQIASANLQAIASQSTNNAADYQVVIPTLMMAMASSVKAIRDTAVTCVSSIASLYPKVKTTGKKNKNIAVNIYKHDTFYGPTSNELEFLLTDQVVALLNEIVKSREEFVTDGDYLANFLAEMLTSSDNDSKAEAAFRNAVLSYLLSHVLAMPHIECRVRLLTLLEQIHSLTKLEQLLPKIESLVHAEFVKAGAVEEINVDYARLLIGAFTPEASLLLKGSSAKYRHAFMQLLKLDSTNRNDPDAEESASSLRRLALNRISRDFFARVGAKLQTEIFMVLMDLVTNAPQETVRVAKQVLRSVDIGSSLIIADLASVQQQLIQEAGVDEESHSKRQRRVTAEEHDPLVGSLHRLVSLLELLEYKPVSDSHNLVTPLFEMMSTILNSEFNKTPVSIEYINQLLLSNLTTFVRQAAETSSELLDEAMLRVDLVVQCIRVTGNPQTHNQALLLMAAMAGLYPEKVLHNIMPVFTFMGANVLRQDDNYSFHVIQQTLEKIIPPLVEARRRQSAESQQVALQVRPIIKVFVDAIFHIPKHRRLRLFSVLISTLGEDEFLYAVLSLVLEKQVDRATKGQQTESDSLNEFALALSNQFSATVQMKALIALMDVVQGLPNEKLAESGDVDMETESLYDLASHNNKHIRHFKLSVLTFSANVLTAKGFLSKVLTLTNTDTSAVATLERHFLQMAERLLTLVGAFTNFVNHLTNRKEPAATAVVRFWRGIVKVTYDVLDKVHILLSLPSFVKIMVALFEHKDPTIRRKAMVLFNQKITSAAAVPPMHRDLVVAVSADLIKVLETDSMEGATTEEVAVNKQTALLCMSTIVRQFGKTHPAEIAKMVPVVIGASGLLHANEQVKASCLVCLTFMCQELGPRLVPFLPKFMPTVLAILTSTLQSADPEVRRAISAAADDEEADESANKKVTQYNNSVLLQLAVVSHLEALIQVLPQFMSSYVTKILAGTLHPVLAGYDGQDSAKRQILERNRALLHAMAHNIPPRILLPPVLAYWPTAVKDGQESVLALCRLVSETVVVMPRDVVAVHYKQIFKFFLGAFDYRRVHGAAAAAAAAAVQRVAAVEEAVIQAFLQLVMKLNETLFKPLFLKTLDWAITELQVMKAGDQDKTDRLVFFFKLLNALLERLKSIIAPYYGYVVDTVIETLTGYALAAKGKHSEENSSSSEDEEEDVSDVESKDMDGKVVAKKRALDELWPWMISTLQKCFLHDSEGLWNAERFDKLLQPLVDQLLVTTDVAAEDEDQDERTVAAATLLSNTPGWKTHEERMDNYMVPCLGQLAVTASSDALWKPLNYQVMLKSRSDQREVRLASLKVLREFYRRLGEEFLILLPETIPFLAELMEDDDHEVEALTQQVIADIEVYLGGSLQKYFH